MELTVFQHTIERTVTLTQSKGLGGIVIGDVDSGILSLLVVVVGALVLIELELTIAAGIDIERDDIGRTLIAVLHLRAKGNDATLADKDGDTLVRSIHDEALSSLNVFASIEIVPSRSLGEVDGTVAGLVVAYGTSHQGRTKHPLVLDILYFTVAIKVHHESAHHGVVLQMYPTCHRVEVGHQTIAQLVVIDKRLIAGMMVWCEVPDFACGPLTVYAEQGDEGTKLAPASLQLTPLFQVLALHACLLVILLGLHITVLHTESTLIHSPEGKTRHRVVETCRHLGTHILPTSTNITRPRSG